MSADIQRRPAARANTVPTPSGTPVLLAGGTPRRRPSSIDALSTLSKPFVSPALKSRGTEDLVLRKRRRVNYAEDAHPTAGTDDNDEAFTIGKVTSGSSFPVFTPRDPNIVFTQRFTVPTKNKNPEHTYRPPPALGMVRRVNFVPKALHDPAGEFAIVLYDPTISQNDADADTEAKEEAAELPKHSTVHKSLAEMLGLNKDEAGTQPNVAVVIDPRLTKVLRPHQVEGVRFLYRCTTGMVDPKAFGCIMADEMGLGKTLQCITLMWTLLRQSPAPGKPTIEKCIIACPSSLVKNWANELVKWLGKDALNPFAVDGKAGKGELQRQLRQWAIAEGRAAAVRPVLIVSYETLRMNAGELMNTEIGLLLCDEGHRLKNNESQTFSALNALNVKRRVILSGTPIQNDLSEYFALLNFANPSLLGTQAEFRKNFEIPILRGRDANGTDNDRTNGDKKLNELGQLVNRFIIRRTNDILSKYLPVKYEHVVFCRLSPFQEALYKMYLTSPDIKKLLKGADSQPLKAVNALKKLCNHPDLLNLQEELPGCGELFPEGYVAREARNSRDREVDSSYSGKFMILERMLYRIRRDTNDKIVVISNYTQTLDLIEQLCRNRRYGSLRLDGTMNVTKRQKIVDKFNDPEGPEFVFLLSSKAGGCGINLIGANRLILIDPDWNPAADQQALARVWRDGQKKDCFVYRFIATGSIEEKIFQRQSHKQSLSSCVVDEKQDVERHFALDDLRQLFVFTPDMLSDTHTTFKCKRCRPDGHQFIKAPAMLYGDTSTWNHFTNGDLSGIQDKLLQQETDKEQVSYVFQYISH
ncbi:P-loop containing nucleoside triphosphate hydrolase protein [Limtongia smithiae]|uniref:P-loop containing nucleoside triphosphate hydrolase protein n=1 Tax=Limtongia smithiae TaxID=1125753 RepID=UPI0034CDA9D8